MLLSKYFNIQLLLLSSTPIEKIKELLLTHNNGSDVYLVIKVSGMSIETNTLIFH